MSEDQDLKKRCSKCRETKPIAAFSKNKCQKDGYQAWCKACVADYLRAYRAANPDNQRAYRTANADQLREYDRIYYATHAEEKREYRRTYHAAHIEADHTYNRAYRAANPDYQRAHYAANAETIREQNRAYNAANAETIREQKRAYRAAHPEVQRAANHRRRARLKANGGTVTHHELSTKRASQRGHCFYCRMPHHPQALTIDHVIPIDQGGPHIIANIVFACGICNSSKGNRTPDQWTNRWYLR